MRFTLDQIAQALGVEASKAAVAAATGWSIDSRTAQPGDVFIALCGPNHDGHLHVAEAFARGAVGAVVERAVAAEGPLFFVSDTLGALQQLASWARAQWGGEIVGITEGIGKGAIQVFGAAQQITEASENLARSSAALDD